MKRTVHQPHHQQAQEHLVKIKMISYKISLILPQLDVDHRVSTLFRMNHNVHICLPEFYYFLTSRSVREGPPRGFLCVGGGGGEAYFFSYYIFFTSICGFLKMQNIFTKKISD